MKTMNTGALLQDNVDAVVIEEMEHPDQSATHSAREQLSMGKYVKIRICNQSLQKQVRRAVLFVYKWI